MEEIEMHLAIARGHIDTLGDPDRSPESKQLLPGWVRMHMDAIDELLAVQRQVGDG